MRRSVILRGLTLTLAMALVSSAQATPFEVAWDGSDWPENQGWSRSWGNLDGWHQGPGAVRTLSDGVLTIDSLSDPGICDWHYMKIPQALDPAPGETAFLEWRLKVDQVNGDIYDAAIGMRGMSYSVHFGFAYDHIITGWSSEVDIPFTPGVFHTYRTELSDPLHYKLYIDGQLSHQDSVLWSGDENSCHWGDTVQTNAPEGGGRHEWDYVRFGILPEPCTLLLLVCGAVVYRRR